MNTMSNTQTQKPQENEIDIAIQLHELWSNKWLILLITILTLSLGVFYASRQMPQYRANILLQIDAKQPGFGQTGVAVQQMLFGGGSSDSAAIQTALIRSRFILEPVINLLKLDLSIKSTSRFFWERFLSSSSSNKITLVSFKVPRSLFNKPLKLLIDSPGHLSLYDKDGHLLLGGKVGALLVTPDKRVSMHVDLLKASVGSQFIITKRSDEKVVNSLLQQLTIEEAGSKQHQSTGVLDISLRGDDPAVIVRTLNTIARITQIKDAKKKSQEASQTLDFMYKQLPLTKNILEKAEHKLNLYRAKSGRIDIKLQTKLLLDQLTELGKQQNVLKIKRVEMLQQYTSSHPALIALNAQVDILKTQQDDLQHNLKLLPASDQVAVNLMRDVKVKQALYLLLLNKIQELQVIKAGTVSSVRILSFAKLPDTSLPAKKMVVYLASILFGLMLSLAVIFGRKIISPRVEDPQWSERHFNLPNLAIVPFCKEQAVNAAGHATHLIKYLPLLAHANPRNLAIESLRSLRTSLQVTLTCAENNVISILGISPSVGKSFVSANFAYLLAAGGKRVLLIDGDLRRGTLHKYFEGQASPGLAELLSKDILVGEALKPTFHENLTFLARGVYPKDPSELLMSDRFKHLISTLSEQYDVIVIDTAPVLLVTDAVVIGCLSATNYLVVGAGVHQPGEMELVLKRLSDAGVQVNGSIFNFHRSAAKSAYYGKYYNHSYYYDETLKS